MEIKNVLKTAAGIVVSIGGVIGVGYVIGNAEKVARKIDSLTDNKNYRKQLERLGYSGDNLENMLSMINNKDYTRYCLRNDEDHVIFPVYGKYFAMYDNAKDIIHLDKYDDSSYIKYIESKGFKVMGCGWRDEVYLADSNFNPIQISSMEELEKLLK